MSKEYKKNIRMNKIKNLRDRMGKKRINNSNNILDVYMTRN